MEQPTKYHFHHLEFLQSTVQVRQERLLLFEKIVCLWSFYYLLWLGKIQPLYSTKHLLKSHRKTSIPSCPSLLSKYSPQHYWFIFSYKSVTLSSFTSPFDQLLSTTGSNMLSMAHAFSTAIFTQILFQSTKGSTCIAQRFQNIPSLTS